MAKDSTVAIHGYEREEEFTRQVGEKAVAAAVAADSRLTPVSFRFRRGQNCTCRDYPG